MIEGTAGRTTTSDHIVDAVAGGILDGACGLGTTSYDEVLAGSTEGAGVVLFVVCHDAGYFNLCSDGFSFTWCPLVFRRMGGPRGDSWEVGQQYDALRGCLLQTS